MGASWYRLLLTETGGNTGVFTGSIALGNPANGTPALSNSVLEPGRNASPAELDTLAHQLDSTSRVVRLGAGAVEPAQAAAALLEAALGVRPADPLFALTAYLLHLRERSERLVVVIDDLDALPPHTAQWLRATLDRSGGALRALGQTRDAASAERAVARLGLDLVRPGTAPAVSMTHDAWLGAAASVLLVAALVALALRLW